MPAGWICFPVFSLATRGQLASCWKASTPLYRPSVSNAPFTRRSYSSIADAMLGRAVKEGVPPPRNDLAKQLFPSSSPAQNGNIQEQFKKARQSQSIGAFTGYTNSSNPLRAKSPNIKSSLKRKSPSYTASIPANSALSSVLTGQDSFHDTPNTIVDLTQGDQVSSKLPASSHPSVLFDENDFDDDAELDLDMDYELPASMAAPPKPSSQKLTAPSPSPYALPKLPRQNQSTSTQNLPSSAVTWSSSSPSHRLPPATASTRTQGSDQTITNEYSLSSKPADPNPPLKKRRTLPWLQDQAESDQVSAAAEEEGGEAMAACAASGSSQRKCIRCQGDHYAKDCQIPGKATKWDFTPLPKDKRMPWNNTGSAVAEEKKKFRDKQKATRKANGAETDAMQRHYATKRTQTNLSVSLSAEQQRVKDLVINETKSVFFTGSAGTGKSVLMRSIIQELKKKYSREPDRVAVTASTGLAACNIGGVTLHSFGGIGLGKEDVPALVKKIKRNQKAKQRWLRTKILIIDEISMVDGELFDKLEGIARMMRNNGRPFGGIQLVVTGDFFQLPPVPDYDNKSRGAKFAFDASTWSTAIHHTIGLTEVFRQKDPGTSFLLCLDADYIADCEAVFANMLNEMRLGKISNETVAAFRKLSRRIDYEDTLEATELFVILFCTLLRELTINSFPTRNEVENANFMKLRALHGNAKKYEALDTGTITDLAMREKLLANMMAPKSIELKKGAQVMLIKNVSDVLVNGSLGKVAAFMDEKTFEIYDNNPELFREGVTEEDLEEYDEATRTKYSKVKASFSLSKESSATAGTEYPLVQFSLADGTIQEILVQREEWKVELPTGEVQAQRSQLPLILAWALSIHKAQGQTLERVKIDLKRVFEKGQAYVALSRATTQAGLEVHNFDKNKVMAHPRVAQFYDSLYSVNQAMKYPKLAKPPSTKKAKAYEEEYLNLEVEESNGWERGKEAAYA